MRTRIAGGATMGTSDNSGALEGLLSLLERTTRSDMITLS